MKEHEKRGRTRVTYASELECENGGTRLFARTHDVSTSGIFIRSVVVWEPGSQLKLRFRVGPTRIETIGEVCYSLPQIGMGVRFLKLNPEHRAAIEKLVDNQQHRGADEDGTPRRSIMQTGVQPVDELLGGVDRGQIYLVRGDSAGKSLFGLQFIIEGLNVGDDCALVIPYSPEDAVRRFARLGYDCREDLESGLLVIIQYPRDTAELLPQQSEPASLLPELESMLSETPRARLVFDPLTTWLAGEENELKTRARAFTAWVRSLDAAVVLIANENDIEIVEDLMPLVKESFRFGVKEDRGRVIRNLIFEKSPNVPDQAIRVDPCRGIYLLDRQQTVQATCPEEIEAGSSGSSSDLLEISSADARETGADTVASPPSPSIEPSALQTESSENPPNELLAMLDELREFASALYLDNIAIGGMTRESFAETAELDSRFQLPADVFEFREQVQSGNNFSVHDEQSFSNSRDDEDGALQPPPLITSRSRQTDSHPQPGELPPHSFEADDPGGRRAHCVPDERRLNSTNGSANREPADDRFKSYGDFLARIFARIEDGLNNTCDSPFAIVSCRVPRMTADGGRVALKLFELVHSVISASDTVTTNKRNDLVILLANTDTVSASAFVTKLRWLVLKEMGQEPSIRLWSLPRPEEATATPSSNNQGNSGYLLAHAERIGERTERGA